MRIITYILVHNFYITAARAADPGLAGKPLAVVKKNRIIDVSPEAAAAGVLAGLTARRALRSCPGLNIINFEDIDHERRATQLARECGNLGPRVQLPSGNAAFLDLSGAKPPSVRIFSSLVEAIVPSLGSFVTVGLAPCRLLAKAAVMVLCTPETKASPPALPGLAVRKYAKFRISAVRPETSEKFASSLPVEAMWPLDGGVIRQMRRLGLNSFADISSVPLTMLHRQFASLAPLIMDYSRGIDGSAVPVFRPPDSIVYHAECDNADYNRLIPVLQEAAAYVSRSLAGRGESYRRLSLSLFFDDCGAETKTVCFNRGKHDACSIYLDSTGLLDRMHVNSPVTEIALSAGMLIPNRHSQLSLFHESPPLHSRAAGRREKLSAVCRDLAAKYSTGIITTGSTLPVSRREQMLMFVDPLRS